MHIANRKKLELMLNFPFISGPELKLSEIFFLTVKYQGRGGGGGIHQYFLTFLCNFSEFYTPNPEEACLFMPSVDTLNLKTNRNTIIQCRLE